ncbi:MAG: leucine-rich repeat protein [Clostridiales bacterium]|nr:leucine-rich repeat protein [Clostridiales bacterium]
MKNKGKKTLVIAVVALFAVFAYFGFTKTMTASAEAIQVESLAGPTQIYATDDDFAFTLVNDSEYKVRIVNKNITQAKIPSEYNGLPVTEIASSGFMSCKYLTTVYLPKSVKKIGANSFYGCKELVRVYGTSKLEEIGSNAFYNCTQLIYFCIPNTIRTLGNTIFKNNPNDIYVRMSEDEFGAVSGISATALNGRTESSNVIFGTDMICEPINEEIPVDGYKLIYAQVSNVMLYRSVDSNVFLCSKDETDENGETKKVPILSIDSDAFDGWTSNELIVRYDEEVATDYPVNICSLAFNCLDVDLISIEVNITIKDEENDGELSTGIFYGAQMQQLNLPDTITAIPDETFNECINLTTIKHGSMDDNKFSEKIDYIGSFAFSGCYNLQKLYIPASVETMGQCVFSDWGTDNRQVVEFDKLLPPITADGLSAWDGQIGELVEFLYKTTTVTLNNNNDQENSTIEAMYGRLLPTILSMPEPPSASKHFAGYYFTENAKDVQYYDENLTPVKIWDEDDIKNEVVELNAVWEENTYSVQLYDGDDIFYEIETIKYDEYYPALETSKPIKSGYEFKGFYSERNGEGVQVYDSELNPMGEKYKYYWDTALYAYWTPNRYRIAFLTGEGEGGTITVYITYQTTDIYWNRDDTEPVLYISAPTRQHYNFSGFALEDGTLYFSGEEVDGEIVAKCIKVWGLAGDGILNAVWTPIDYTITYYDYTGSETPKNTINIEELKNDYNGVFKTKELEMIKYGAILTWRSVTITIDNIGDIVVEPDTGTIVSIKDCYDSSTGSYQIWYPSQLYEVRTITSGRLKQIVGKFELMRDLDLSSYSSWIPFHDFAGTFEGHSHKISGMNISNVTGPNLGLFAINSGTIIRLTVGGTIKVSGTTTIYAGLLCGKNIGRIENCYTEKGGSYSIISSSDVAYIGGLVGLNSNGIVYKAANSADIYGQGNIGGVVGKNDGSESTSFISFSSNTGKINAIVKTDVSIGGIVAVMTGGTIGGCTSAGAITIYATGSSNLQSVTPRAGKVVGTLYFNNSIYDTQLVIMEDISISGVYYNTTYVKGDVGETNLTPASSL